MLGQQDLPEPEDEDAAGAKPQLSDREAAILNAVAEGAPNKVIAYRMCITEATVKVHVKAILRKIRAKNRTQAAIWASRHQSSSGEESHLSALTDPDWTLSRHPALATSSSRRRGAQSSPKRATRGNGEVESRRS